jgi:hypothetical protein
VIDTPSILRLIRKVAALARVLPTFAFRMAENAARRNVFIISKKAGAERTFFFLLADLRNIPWAGRRRKRKRKELR